MYADIHGYGTIDQNIISHLRMGPRRTKTFRMPTQISIGMGIEHDLFR